MECVFREFIYAKKGLVWLTMLEPLLNDITTALG